METKYFSLSSNENNKLVKIIQIVFGIVCFVVAIFWLIFNIRLLKAVPSAFNNLILKINQKIATTKQTIPKTICIIFTSLLFSFELSEKYFVSIYEFYRQFIPFSQEFKIEIVDNIFDISAKTPIH